MTVERSREIEFIRSEIVGPARDIINADKFNKVSPDAQLNFDFPSGLKAKGMPLFWRPSNIEYLQEIIHYQNETPFNRYGSGILFPSGLRDQQLQNATVSTLPEFENDVELETELVSPPVSDDDSDPATITKDGEQLEGSAEPDDFDVSSPDIFKPCSMGISFCVKDSSGSIEISLPDTKRFSWQNSDQEPFQVNGRYERGQKIVRTDKDSRSYPVYLRVPASNQSLLVSVPLSSLQPGKKIIHKLSLPESSPLNLNFEIFPRRYSGSWIITVVLRNTRSSEGLNTRASQITHSLFQSYFEVRMTDGAAFSEYPEGIRPFDEYDEDEKTLALLYEDSATWAIGHGCSAAWDGHKGVPDILAADVMPAVELPSMTPDVVDETGKPLELSMIQLAKLPEYGGDDDAWKSLENLVELYEKWIDGQKININALTAKLSPVGKEHIEKCEKSLERLKSGIDLLRFNKKARKAFCLANESMLKQQYATKKIEKRPLHWNGNWVSPVSPKDPKYINPSKVLLNPISENIGKWRAFQIAFFLLSLEGLVNEETSLDRDIVDLIWFPTGGGKTEAYLGVISFYLFFQRLKMDEDADDDPLRDGTGVFMRYTLRMLTTQQFQRAASLICAMEHIRSTEFDKGHIELGETRFSLGLWIGGDGSPNKASEARTRLNRYKKGKEAGNPLVLTECPWCRSEIGALTPEEDPRPSKDRKAAKWSDICIAGIGEYRDEPILKCSDDDCHFGGEYGSLPVEVIDERIYRLKPSLFIGTADKFAMLAYKPEAGALFGRDHSRNGEVKLTKRPPGLIVQDEFHLISGPLGTMYGVYEGIIEKLCSYSCKNGEPIKPKIVSSTATIRGAKEQINSVYAREKFQLFPSPGLTMEDSFFGRYHMLDDGKTLSPGRLYLGIQANSYGSFLTTQVRVFTALLFRTWFFSDNKKDAWWTLLAFYNSLRELGGARTLFSSDIASRLKNYFYRYGCEKDNMRYLNRVEELTSRKSQAELVSIMDQLSAEWQAGNYANIDACLASNIIEVGVDIDRLSVMAVVGQPKSTAQYIQVTGRVGRRWEERPGLILMLFNPAKSRDISHFEQFSSYHRRLYERVEPTSATPFSVEAIKRAMSGALLLWARQFYSSNSPRGHFDEYNQYLSVAKEILDERCKFVLDNEEECNRVLDTIDSVYERIVKKWKMNPQSWEQFPQKSDGEYLMLWPGQFSTDAQRKKGITIPSSMRNVDANAYMNITELYVEEDY